ncbi:MAG: type VI secretion system tube protein Hcp [Polyangiaceae bacterium]
MAADMFLKIDDIVGESKDDKHKDAIEVLAWSWGVTQSGTAHIGGGAGAGKVNVHDVTIQKLVDKSSHLLLKYCCSGKHLKTAELTTRKAGGDSPVEYVKITMSDLIITAVNFNSSGGSLVSESVTLNFGKVKFEYSPQHATSGATTGSISTTWDITANKEA